MFASVSADVSENIEVTSQRKLNPGEVAWGDVSGRRDYEWSWAGQRCSVTFHIPEIVGEDLHDTDIINGDKQYSLSLDRKTTKGGQGDMGRARGTYEMPSDFAFQLEGKWLADALDRFRWQELRQENDPQLGTVVILRGMTDRGSIEFTFSTSQGYLPVRQKRVLAGKLSEYRITAVSNADHIFFPMKMVSTLHESDTPESPISRTRTLEVKNIVFNHVPGSAFEPHWREGMIVKDSDTEIVYVVDHGRLVVSKFSAKNSSREMVAGLTFLVSFVVVGLMAVRYMLGRRTRHAAA